ncbi:MAG: kelch repeat-containing protein [Planctomycetota bacterium]|nr:kelch repeat-containing protein [Planctomycetota bacterium]
MSKSPLSLLLPGLCAGLVLSAPASANDTVRSGGVLGTTVTYQLTGNPGVIYAFVPSLNAGPTPLFLLDPSSLAVMEVGLDLQALWKVSVLNGLGQATVIYPLPNSPALQGLALRSQWFEIPIVPSFVGDLSPLNVFTMGAPDTAVFTDGNQADEIYAHTANSLDDGRVALIGGSVEDSIGNDLFRDQIQTFDPQTETFTIAQAIMGAERAAHTSTKLPDGRVLIAGGANGGGGVEKLTEIWDPTSDSIQQVSDLTEERTYHTATLLNDGRVLVVGGVGLYDFSDIVAGLNSARKSLEIYDPSTDIWSAGPDLPKGRVGHQASILPDGRVLITGGLEVGSVFGIPTPELSSDCRIYDPTSNTLSAAAQFSDPRALHAQLVLPDGRVLLNGGFDGNLLLLSFNPLTSTRLYTPATNSWTNVGDMNVPRGIHGIVNRPGGGVAVIGGVSTLDLTEFKGSPEPSMETSSGSFLSWTNVGSLNFPRDFTTATPYEGGTRVLLQGRGDNGIAGVADLTAEIFHP